MYNILLKFKSGNELYFDGIDFESMRWLNVSFATRDKSNSITISNYILNLTDVDYMQITKVTE